MFLFVLCFCCVFFCVVFLCCVFFAVRLCVLRPTLRLSTPFKAIPCPVQRPSARKRLRTLIRKNLFGNGPIVGIQLLYHFIRFISQPPSVGANR